jgi:WD40 repeat protein/tRNA A-37 threonylcarbamoyl transferase component Bud32
MGNRPNRVGQQLGNYRLVSVLGEGRFAEVYLGEHILLGTQAAVKVFHTQLIHKHIEAFRMDARIIAHLIHPHIMRVLEFGVEGRTPFLVMDYAPKGTLRQLHPKGTALAIATIVTYVKQVADALQYAHDEKMIHRDVKPENMLVGHNNNVQLSDFSIAVVAQSTDVQSIQQAIGTATYMSPEHIQGKPCAASDQYALGIVVYEWLCGDSPFQGSFSELCIQHMSAPPPLLREKMPTISPEVEHVVMMALSKDPTQRFANVRAFATALEQASQLGSDQQPPVFPKEVTPSSQPSLPPTFVTPPHGVPEPTTGSPSPSHLFHVPEAPHSQQPIPKRTSSRRAVIAALGGLTLVSGGIIWLTALRGPIPGSVPATTATPLPLGTTLYIYHGHADQVFAVAWSPDGKRIASGSRDTTVQVWDVANGGHVYTYPGHTDSVLSVTWSPDGKRIASASWDKTVQVWNAIDGSNAYTYKGHTDSVPSVAWSPDGKRIASASYDKTVQVWNATDGSHIYTYTGHSGIVMSVAWSPDGKHIASTAFDMTVQVWDATDGSNTYTYTGHTGPVLSVAWSPNGKHVASASYDNTVSMWEVTNGSHRTYQGHSDQVCSVAWSPDSKRVASGSYDKTVRVWNAVDSSQISTYRGHSNPVASVAWSPDGKRIASASWDKTVQIWVAP